MNLFKLTYSFRWHVSLKKVQKKQEISKRRKTEHEVIEITEMLRIYFSSQVRFDLLQGIINHDTRTKMTQNSYYTYRVVLVGEVIYRNAQRTGLVLGMRRSEVKVAVWQSNLLKITVYDHKTGK